MNVHLVAFATASDIVGKDPQTLELADGSSLSDLQRLLTERYPALEPLWPRLAIAVDGQLARTDAPLKDGAEVALLPPVSGGSGAATATPAAEAAVPETPLQKADLVDDAIDLASVEAMVRSPTHGAVLLFLGTVRNHHQGQSVARLTYSAYRPMARTQLQRIVDELEASPDPIRVAIVHRLGDVEVGEPSVVIATSSPHRAAAYEANRLALERLKREVPIWKREHYEDGSAVWREEESLTATED